MPDTLTTLVQLAPSLAKLATDLVSTSDAAKRNAQLIEFQNALIGFQSLIASVQQENAALIQQKRDAEEELKRMKDWETQKQRYQLVQAFDGAVLYAVKQAMSNGEPPHYICVNCYEQGKRSILQNKQIKGAGTVFACPACRAEAPTGYMGSVPPEYAEHVSKRH